jgi:hypothetical protein
VFAKDGSWTCPAYTATHGRSYMELLSEFRRQKDVELLAGHAGKQVRVTFDRRRGANAESDKSMIWTGSV